jgi:hypothetical protein
VTPKPAAGERDDALEVEVAEAILAAARQDRVDDALADGKAAPPPCLSRVKSAPPSTRSGEGVRRAEAEARFEAEANAAEADGAAAAAETAAETAEGDAVVAAAGDRTSEVQTFVTPETPAKQPEKSPSSVLLPPLGAPQDVAGAYPTDGEIADGRRVSCV